MMKTIAVNPYLPAWEYVPDGEPHIFGDRVYVYGSHDISHGKSYCVQDYVCWSAPVDDLGNWKNEGVIYKRTDDLPNTNPCESLYAPDVCKGSDGRYYLYYCPANDGQKPYRCGVAVCDTPAGHYTYLADVNLPQCKEFMIFDPGVFVDDDKRVWLYYGFGLGNCRGIKDMLAVKGGAVVELDKDMHTIISKPKLTVPNMFHAKKTGYDGHAFFEASSMRKVNGKYYFIYSSQVSHELCYAVSDKPNGDFVYGGTLISNGDIGLNDNKKAKFNTVNNHGSLLEINGQWYIFWHRHTQRTGYSRQACADKITLNPDGTFSQAEMTSCGLNGGALPAKGTYSAHIACNILDAKYHGRKATYINEEGSGIYSNAFVHNIRGGVSVGFKYFEFTKPVHLEMEWRLSVKKAPLTRGNIPVKGTLEVYNNLSARPLATVHIHGVAHYWQKATVDIDLKGKQPLFIKYAGDKAIDLNQISFIEKEYNETLCSKRRAGQNL